MVSVKKNQEKNETGSNIYPRIDIKFDSLVKSMTQIVWLDQPTKKKRKIIRKLTCFKKQLPSFKKAVIIKGYISVHVAITAMNCCADSTKLVENLNCQKARPWVIGRPTLSTPGGPRSSGASV